MVLLIKSNTENGQVNKSGQIGTIIFIRMMMLSKNMLNDFIYKQVSTVDILWSTPKTTSCHRVE